MNLNRPMRTLLLTVLLLGTSSLGAFAQDQGRSYVGGGPFLLEDKNIRCHWFYWADPPDRFVDVDVQLTAGGRSYSTFGFGLQSLFIGITLDGTYLPNDYLSCGSNSAADKPLFVWDWEIHTAIWSNDTCSGMSPPIPGRTPTDAVSFGFDVSVTTPDWDDVRFGFATGGNYWPAVGSSQSVNNPMYTPTPGGDRLVASNQFLPSHVPAEHDYANALFWVNPAFKNKPQSFWAVVGAHELGHALNSDHCASCDLSSGIMVSSIPGNASGLNPRDLDKCWIVKYLNPNIVTYFE
jgi:hypothetical protein